MPFRHTNSDCSLLHLPSIDSTIFLILNIRCMCYYYRYLVTLPMTCDTYIHHTCCHFRAPSAGKGPRIIACVHSIPPMGYQAHRNLSAKERGIKMGPTPMQG